MSSKCGSVRVLRLKSIRHTTGIPTCQLLRHREAYGKSYSCVPQDPAKVEKKATAVSLPHHGEWWEPARAVRRGAAHGSGGRDAFSASRSAGRAGPRVIEGEAKSGNEEVGRGSGEVETKANKKSFQLEKNIFHLFDPWPPSLARYGPNRKQ